MKKKINEDFSEASEEPSSQAAAQAQQLGLEYVGFGRYADPKTNQITYIVQNDQLVPFKKAIKTSQYRSEQSDDIGNYIAKFSEETQIANSILSQAYLPTNYDENELAAIQQFSSQSYGDINAMLSELPAGISLKDIQPSGPNDSMLPIISALDSAMKRLRSPIDFNTYVKLDAGGQVMLNPGNQFRFKGYKNTSIDMSQVLTPDESKVNILQIMVRKNSRGIYTANYSQTPEEGEFILPRGAKIEILSGPTRLVGSDGQQGGNHKEIYYYECQTKS